MTLSVQHVALISSRPGAIRGNHVHQTDNHFTYLLSGRARYHQLVDGVVESCWLEAGEMVLTLAGVPHAFVFEEESVFLAFCTAERMGGKYQEDTQPCILVQG
jgi:quercetin dioxygenase-like cupin family protein